MMKGALQMAKLDHQILRIRDCVGMLIILFLVTLLVTGIDFPVAVATTAAGWGMAGYLPAVFSNQEKNGMERLYASLPLDRRDIVLGRYLFYYANFVLALAVTLAAGVVIPLLNGKTVTLTGLVTGMALALFLFAFISSVQLAVYFSFGYAKGALVSWLPFLVLVLLFVSGNFWRESMYEVWRVFGAHLVVVNVICVVASVGMIVVSYRVALKNFALVRA